MIEATIDGIHAELQAGRLSCVQLVQAYLNRIKAYDQAGPTLNAVQNLNPNALVQAAQLDAQRSVGANGIGPLYCIPVLLKDQVDTNFMPTTYGSALFKTFVPERNATLDMPRLGRGRMNYAYLFGGRMIQHYHQAIAIVVAETFEQAPVFQHRCAISKQGPGTTSSGGVEATWIVLNGITRPSMLEFRLGGLWAWRSAAGRRVSPSG